MKLVGVMYRHETIYQILVQNPTELSPKLVKYTQIEDGVVCNKP